MQLKNEREIVLRCLVIYGMTSGITYGIKSKKCYGKIELLSSLLKFIYN